MARRVPLGWRLRKRFWSTWQTLRFRLSKPQHIGPPKPNRGRIDAIPMGEKYPSIPMRHVRVYRRLPKEEASIGMRLFVRLGLILAKIVPQMGKDLPEIDADIDKALKSALTRNYRKAYRAPVLPAELPPDPDLGALAAASPYSAFLARSPDDGFVHWDFRVLNDFEHHPGLRPIGVRVVFAESIDTRKLTAREIHTADHGVVRRGDAGWREAKRLAICAATTHMALTRHFNYVHLVSGDHWDIAARNHLPSDHPVYRLLWPSVFNSLYTNHGVTRVQLLPDGDFVNMFSFTHAGLIAYYDAMYQDYTNVVTDPVADWERRGLADAKFDCPSQQNLVELFTIMRDHASRYLHAYYGSDDELRADGAVAAFLAGLGELVPNGIGGLLGGEVTRDSLARLFGGYIYEGNTVHDMAGTTLWDYQLWADRNPTRIYADDRRIPVDVLQRIINNNFALQLRRAPLLADYGEVALDEKGRALFTQFYEECRALQDRYDQAPAGPWRMEPKNLEISMNG